MTSKKPSLIADDSPTPDKFPCSSQAFDTLLKIAADNRGVISASGVGRERTAHRHKSELNSAFDCFITKPGSSPAVLTADGRELAKITREYVAALDQFKRKCQKLPPKITIAAGDSVVNWIILPALKNFLTRQKKIFFSVRDGGTKGLITLLHASQIDFAIIPENARCEKKWKREAVGAYEYCICCPKSLLEGKNLDEKSLSELGFAMITNHWQLDFLKKARDVKIKLNIKIMCETFTQVASLVRTGSFAGILPLSTMSSFSKEKFQWFKPEFMEGTNRIITLVWKPDGAHIKTCVDETAMPLLEQLKYELTKKQNCRSSNFNSTITK